MSRGWCSLHYNRWCCHGDPLYVKDQSRGSAVVRFKAKVKVNAETGCWEWQGHVNRNTGYGTFRIGQEKRGPAHRRGWELLRGPIAADLQLDHLCRVRHCVNPDHLEPVPAEVNMQRAYAARTECKRGHPYPGSGQCKPCRNLGARERRAAANGTLPASL
jgi:hypothetical protein